MSRALPSSSIGSSSCAGRPDRKSTRLNSSHGYISYAVFCLKKKKKQKKKTHSTKQNFKIRPDSKQHTKERIKTQISTHAPKLSSYYARDQTYYKLQNVTHAT